MVDTMNSLLSDTLQDALSRWDSFRRAASSLAAAPAVRAEVAGLHGSATSFFVPAFADASRNNCISSLQYSTTKRYPQGQNAPKSPQGLPDCMIIVPTEKDAADVMTDLDTALEGRAETYLFPWWGVLPYRGAATGSAVFGARAGVLAALALRRRTFSRQTRPRIFVVTQRALQSPVPDPAYVRTLAFSMRAGAEIDPTDVAARLVSLGYVRVPKTGVPGEFTLRGEVLDIFPPLSPLPVRVVFDFDAVGQIKSFDPETQTTVAPLDELLVYPMKEVVWTDELVARLREGLERRERGGEGVPPLVLTEAAKKARERLLGALSHGRAGEGEELFYPALWERRFTVLDYLDDDAAVFFFDYDRLANAQESFEREYAGMFRKARQELPVLPPSEMLIPFSAVAEMPARRIFFRTLRTDGQAEAENASPAERYDIPCAAPRSFFGNINYLKEELAALRADGWRIVIYADNAAQSLRVKEILQDVEGVRILPQAISAGFGIPDGKVLFVQENEIFGRRRNAPKSLRKGVRSAVIDTFVDVAPGDYVVHVNYGIGIFKGIQRVKAGGNERDYIKLEYADEEFAFVPIEQVNLVQRYIGNEGVAPHIDRIGSKSWENRKNRVRKAVEDLAQKLIDLYSRRKASRGFPFPKDGEWQVAFEAAFPYEDTPDQYTVTQEVKADMEKPVPMDRLVCGDVGYGKTEIAMRAAFKAVMGGKQVAFLAPTTILAEQHYETCAERFTNFPVTIAQLSRFVAPAEQKKVIARLAKGEIDILVGTHRIIQKDVIFRDLGLMIIDEEQRFGVKDKERLKALKTNIDSLAMSATPIPRTLHMSLLKIRDMSLLTTPPQNRRPIETVVDEYREERVAAAIRREVERGGQVFFLHNRVESLDDVRRKLSALLPEMLIDVAHGQLTADELDDIFRRFKMGGFHVLVATTIIENGIDIPNVNTIIIDRADMYGVSQLYQLRGRVGRSDRTAYAYLLYPENKALSEVAMRRLQVISDFTELGSGFKIAMKDMEIRGAGNLLGRDQSGDVYSVGFDLYLRLLNEAVERLTQQESYREQNEVLMELEYTGFIPDTYVQNPQTKMEIYKKVAAVQTRDEMEHLFLELEDRFGPAPDEVHSLLSLAEVRVIARRLGVRTLRERQGIIQIEFGRVSDISVDKVLRLIKESAGRARLDPTMPNTLLLSTGKIGLKEKSAFIREQLEKLE